jgi:hypothetical protein
VDGEASDCGPPPLRRGGGGGWGGGGGGGGGGPRCQLFYSRSDGKLREDRELGMNETIRSALCLQCGEQTERK